MIHAFICLILVGTFILHAEEHVDAVQSLKTSIEDDASHESLPQDDLYSVADDDEAALDFDDEESEDAGAKLVLLDQIEAVVAEGNDVQVIAMSDVAKRNFDGNQHTVDDLINELLFDFIAQKLRITVDDDDVNKYLQRMKLSRDQIIAIARSNGYYDLTEFYDQFKKMYRSNQAMSFKVNSELSLGEDEIQDFYDANPQVEEAVYTIEMTTVPFDKNRKIEEQQKELEQFVDGSLHRNFIWEAPVVLKASEISSANDFIFSMKEGSYYLKKSSDGFDIIKLKKLQPERIIPLDERRGEIMTTLKAERYGTTVESVVKKVRDQALILTPTYAAYPVPVYVGDL